MASTTSIPRRAPVSVVPAPPWVTDEELLRRMWEGDAEALDVLLDRYRTFVRLKARSYFLVGADRDDVVQEGMVGLYKAIRDYDPGHATSFRGFAELCVVRQIITAIKTATRQKHAPLNSYVSLHTPVSDEQGDGELGEQFAGGDDPEAWVMHLGEMSALRTLVGQVLSPLEIEVLHRYVGGDSYAEIALALGRQVKSIDNAIQRIKRKLGIHLRAQRHAG